MHCAADNLHPTVMKLLLKSCTQEALNAADVKVLLSLDHDICLRAFSVWARASSHTAFVLHPHAGLVLWLTALRLPRMLIVLRGCHNPVVANQRCQIRLSTSLRQNAFGSV